MATGQRQRMRPSAWKRILSFVPLSIAYQPGFVLPNVCDVIVTLERHFPISSMPANIRQHFWLSSLPLSKASIVVSINACYLFRMAIKYCLFSFMLANYANTFDNPYTWLWIISSIVSSCYSYTWDIKMDWGLFDKNAGENTFLREEVVYSSTVSRLIQGCQPYYYIL